MFDLWTWMNSLVQGYGYLGAFAVCVLGNVTIFLPIPFAFVIYAFGATLDPLLLGLIGGLGCTVGESSAYLLGRGGRKIVEGKYGERLNAVEKLIDRYGAVVVFLTALLPVPDDIILIPLGMLKYDFKKVLVAMFLGKTLMCLILSYAGRFSYSMVITVFESSGFIGVVVSLALLVIIIYAMLKVDWTRLVEDVTKPPKGHL